MFSISLLWIKPPIAKVSPSFRRNLVSTFLVLFLGILVPIPASPKLLTSGITSISISSFSVIQGVNSNKTPAWKNSIIGVPSSSSPILYGTSSPMIIFAFSPFKVINLGLAKVFDALSSSNRLKKSGHVSSISSICPNLFPSGSSGSDLSFIK